MMTVLTIDFQKKKEVKADLTVDMFIRNSVRDKKGSVSKFSHRDTIYAKRAIRAIISGSSPLNGPTLNFKRRSKQAPMLSNQRKCTSFRATIKISARLIGGFYYIKITSSNETFFGSQTNPQHAKNERLLADLYVVYFCR